MPDPLPTERFNHAALNCREVEPSVAFYTRVLGFHRVERPGFDFRGAWLYREGLGMMLHLIENPNFAPERSDEGRPPGAIYSRRHHLAFRVADIDAATRLLREHNVPHQEKRLPTFGYRQVFFHDPDGNLLEIGEWPDAERMATAPIDEHS